MQAFLAALVGGEVISDSGLAEMTDPGTDGYGLGLVVLTNDVALQPTALSDQLTADW